MPSTSDPSKQTDLWKEFQKRLAANDPPHASFFSGPIDAGRWIAEIDSVDAASLASAFSARLAKSRVREIAERLMALKLSNRHEFRTLIKEIESDARVAQDAFCLSMLKELNP